MSFRQLLLSSASILVAAACGQRASRPDAVSAVAIAVAGDDEAVAVCDSVAAEWKRRGSAASVRSVADTLISEHDDPFVYQDAPQHRACLTVVREEHHRPDPQPIAHGSQGEPLWRIGWTPIDNMTADGPDGGEQGYMRGGVRCLVIVDQDGDDDSDSTYVPADWRVETTMCWRSRQQKAGR